jgi:hypothetical protein
LLWPWGSSLISLCPPLRNRNDKDYDNIDGNGDVGGDGEEEDNDGNGGRIFGIYFFFCELSFKGST